MGNPINPATIPQPPAATPPTPAAQPTPAPVTPPAAPAATGPTPAAAPEPSMVPTPATDFKLTPAQMPFDWGGDASLEAKFQRTRNIAENLAHIQSLDPAARTQALKQLGIPEHELPAAITQVGGELKEEQAQVKKIGEQAQATAETKETQANVLEAFGHFAYTTGMLGTFVLAAPEVLAAAAAGESANIITGLVAKNVATLLIGNMVGDVAQKAANAVMPDHPYINAGIAILAAGVATAGADKSLEYWQNAIDQVSRTSPEIGAAIENTKDMFQEPVGKKAPEVAPTAPKVSAEMQNTVDQIYAGKPKRAEVKQRAQAALAGMDENDPLYKTLTEIAEEKGRVVPRKLISAEEAGATAEKAQAEPPGESPAGGQPEETTRLYRAEPTVKGGAPDWVKENLKGSAQQAASGRWFTKDPEALNWYLKDIPEDQRPRVVSVDVPNSQLEQHLVSNNPEAAKFSRDPDNEYFLPQELAAQAKEGGAPPEKPPEPPGGGKPPEKPAKGEPPKKTPEQAQQELEIRQGKLARSIRIEENEHLLNPQLKQDPTDLRLYPQDIADLQQVEKISSSNMYKIALERIKANAQGDFQKVSDLQDLWTHEVAKMGHVQRILGTLPRDIDLTHYAAQLSVDMPVVSKMFVGLKAETARDLALRQGKFTGLLSYLDPYKAGATVQLWNPVIWVGKALTDMVWLTGNNLLKGLSHLASFHPEDSVHLWLASGKGTIDAIDDAFRWAIRSAKTGSREAENALGMTARAKNQSYVWGSDYNEMTGGQAIQGTASLFTSIADKVSKVLNLGHHVILSEDQFAKTFAWNAAAGTVSAEQAMREATEKGLWFRDRWQYVQLRKEELVRTMPEDITKRADAEAVRLTFTGRNDLAHALSQVAEYFTLPATRFNPELHFGRTLMMFVNTPMNMMAEGLTMTPMAPMMPQFWHDMAGEGANIDTRRLALTKLAVGSVLTAKLWDYVGNNLMTGDLSWDPHQRELQEEMGMKPRMIGIGDHRYSYKELGPISNMLAFIANSAYNFSHVPEANRGQYIKILSMTVAQTLSHGPMAYQAAAVMDSLDSMRRGDPKAGEKLLADMASSVIEPSVMRDIAEIMDPTIKRGDTVLQRMAADNPYTRAGVPIKRNQWGYVQYVNPTYTRDEIPPTTLESILYGIDPFKTTHTGPFDEVELEQLAVGAEFKEPGEAFVGPNPSDSVTVDPNDPNHVAAIPYHESDENEDIRRRDRLFVIEGHELEIDGMNQHDYMLDTIHSEEYQKNLTKYGKRMRLEMIHGMFMDGAKMQLATVEYPDIGERYYGRGEKKYEALTGEKIGAP